MPAINCDQFTKILDDKLNPLNSTISELKKSGNEAMSFLEVVNAKYIVWVTLNGNNTVLQCMNFSLFK